jgi:hypothetical protein
MKKIFLLLSALILCAPILTCSDLGQTVNLKIYYSAAGFSGYYVSDSGSAVLISGGTSVASDPAGMYEANISMYTSLKVQVSSTSTTNTLSVMVYKDSKLVKEGTSTGTGSSGTAASVALLYEYDPSTTTTTTTK